MCMLILIGMVAPPVLFWLLFLRTPSVMPEAVREVIAASNEDVLLIDVRPKSEYEEFSLKGSVNIPADIISSQPQGSWREMLKEKKHVFVICNCGISSALATDQLHDLGFTGALNVAGGLDAWRAVGKQIRKFDVIRVKTRQGEADAVPRIEFTLLEQMAICVSAFGIKPLYELISLILVIWLWRRDEPDLAALRRAMLAFFIGENACAANYLFFNEQSVLMEFFHIYGMLVCFGLAGYALMRAADIRVMKFSEPDEKCALLPLCKRCYKYRNVPCNLRMLFLFFIPAAAVITFMPLTAELGSYFYVGSVFDSEVIFGHTLIQQVIEIRLCPLISLLFFVLSYVMLLFRKEKGFESSKVFFAAGLGPLGFGLMRFVTFWGYSENPLWAEVWEEISEFLFVTGVFWIILRAKLTSISHKGTEIGTKEIYKKALWP